VKSASTSCVKFTHSGTTGSSPSRHTLTDFINSIALAMSLPRGSARSSTRTRLVVARPTLNPFGTSPSYSGWRIRCLPPCPLSGPRRPMSITAALVQVVRSAHQRAGRELQHHRTVGNILPELIDRNRRWLDLAGAPPGYSDPLGSDVLCQAVGSFAGHVRALPLMSFVILAVSTGHGVTRSLAGWRGELSLSVAGPRAPGARRGDARHTDLCGWRRGRQPVGWPG